MRRTKRSPFGERNVANKLRKLEKKFEKQQHKAERTQTKLVRARDKQTASANGSQRHTASS